MRVKHCFDLSRVDVHATRDDHVDPPVADVEVALLVPVRDVSHREKSFVQAAAGGIGPVEILGEPVAADHELPRLPNRGLGPVRAHEADLLTGQGGSARSGLAKLVFRPEDGVDAGLGRAIELPHHLA